MNNKYKELNFNQRLIDLKFLFVNKYEEISNKNQKRNRRVLSFI